MRSRTLSGQDPGRSHQSYHTPPPPRRQEDERRPDREHQIEEAHYSEASSLDQGGARRPATRHPAEDACVAIERRHKRQTRFTREIEEAGHTARGTPGGGTTAIDAGCQAFTPELWEVVWPIRFKPDLPPLYDGTTNPVEFLQLYTTGIQAAHNQANIMVNWFLMALKGSAQSWLMNLTPSSIASSDELCEQFITNFRGTFDRPGAITDLSDVRQRKEETLCKFIQRISQVRNSIPRINDAEVVAAFRNGVEDPRTREKMAVHDVRMTVELFELADKCARAVEARDRPPGRGSRRSAPPTTRRARSASPQRSSRRSLSGSSKRRRKTCPPMVLTAGLTACCTTHTRMRRPTAVKSSSWGRTTRRSGVKRDGAKIRRKVAVGADAPTAAEAREAVPLGTVAKQMMGAPKTTSTLTRREAEIFKSPGLWRASMEVRKPPTQIDTSSNSPGRSMRLFLGEDP